MTMVQHEHEDRARSVEAGWYDDPWRLAPFRFWDGNQWTSATAAARPVPSRTGEGLAALFLGLYSFVPLGGLVGVVAVALLARSQWKRTGSLSTLTYVALALAIFAMIWQVVLAVATHGYSGL